MAEHQVIWLQPWCAECAHTDGRTWCQDSVYEQCECGEMPVKYVLAPDQPARPKEETEE